VLTDEVDIIKHQIDNQLFRPMEANTGYNSQDPSREEDEVEGRPDEEEFSVWVV
jgi:hypothetical protein